jgi:hypothetical protein
MLPESGRWNQLPGASDDEQVLACRTDRTWRQYIPTWCAGAPRRLKHATSRVPMPDAAAKPATIAIGRHASVSGTGCSPT